MPLTRISIQELLIARISKFLTPERVLLQQTISNLPVDALIPLLNHVELLSRFDQLNFTLDQFYNSSNPLITHHLNSIEIESGPDGRTAKLSATFSNTNQILRLLYSTVINEDE